MVEARRIYSQPIYVIYREREDISGSTVRKHLTDYLCNNLRNHNLCNQLRTNVLR